MTETPDPRRALTDNEVAILRASAAGLASDAVAARLGITTREVEIGLRGAMATLGARSRIEAVVAALRLGLIDRPEEPRRPSRPHR